MEIKRDGPGATSFFDPQKSSSHRPLHIRYSKAFFFFFLIGKHVDMVTSATYRAILANL